MVNFLLIAGKSHHLVAFALVVKEKFAGVIVGVFGKFLVKIPPTDGLYQRLLVGKKICSQTKPVALNGATHGSQSGW
jgi:hypothetical protein